ncbi:uncharacterized protein LOC132902341 [Amyelois transitella]|uniref:uncharacterized protein LOC132902341 n=1 Tax=Amyelois transitella TaxID=680683 RepID=UPI00298FA85C|nr:uncharacterized protein LOC132902341 [Amyelois transitella]
MSTRKTPSPKHEANRSKRKTPDCHCNIQEIMSDFQKKMTISFNESLATQSEQINSSLNLLRDDVNSFTGQINELNATMHKIIEDQSTLKEEITDLRSSNDKTNKKMVNIECDVNNLASKVSELTDQLRLKEQQGRINNLEITGIPIVKGENLYTIVGNIASKIGISLKPTDIDFIHRVRRFNNAQTSEIKPARDATLAPNIIVRFTQRKRKTDMLTAARARRGLTTADAGLDGPASPIFISDHLTPQNKLLYKQVRTIAKEKLYKYVWLSDCKIFVRKSDTSHAILVSRESDLIKIK